MTKKRKYPARKCPKCGSRKTVRTGSKKKRIHCKSCGRDTNIMKCISCGSYHVIKSGFDSGIQAYKCKNCGKWFKNPTMVKSKIAKPRIIKPKTLPKGPKIYEAYSYPNASKLFELEKRRIRMNIDSIIDIPCFCCIYNFDKQQCDPSRCHDMTDYVMRENFQ